MLGVFRPVLSLLQTVLLMTHAIGVELEVCLDLCCTRELAIKHVQKAQTNSCGTANIGGVLG